MFFKDRLCYFEFLGHFFYRNMTLWFCNFDFGVNHFSALREKVKKLPWEQESQHGPNTRAHHGGWPARLTRLRAVAPVFANFHKIS